MGLRERFLRLWAMVRGNGFLWMPFAGYFVAQMVLVGLPLIYLYFKYVFFAIMPQTFPTPGGPPPPDPKWVKDLEAFFKDPEPGLIATYDWFGGHWQFVLGVFSLVALVVMFLYAYSVWVDGFYTSRHLAGWKKLAVLQRQQGDWDIRPEAFASEVWQPAKDFTRKYFYGVLGIHVYVHLFMIFFGGGFGLLMGNLKGGMPTADNILTLAGWQGLGWGFGCSLPVLILVWVILWPAKQVAVLRYLVGEEKGPFRALLGGIQYSFGHPAVSLMLFILAFVIFVAGMIVSTIVQCVPVLGLFLKGAVNMLVAPVTAVIATDYLIQHMGYEDVFASKGQKPE